MGIDSCLALLKDEVSEVSGVQPSPGAALGRYPTKIAEVSGVSGTPAGDEVDTPDTSRFAQGYQPKPAPDKACTRDTRDTSRIEQSPSEMRNAATSWRWLMHYADREPMEVFIVPEPTWAEVLGLYPDAVAATPIADREGMVPFDLEAWLERAAIAEYDGGLSRADAEAMAWAEDDARWELLIVLINHQPEGESDAPDELCR